MSILKAPPKQSKNATLQARIDEDLKTKLEKYAEFLGTTGAYVVSEALKLVFNKDVEFKEWLDEEQRKAKVSDEALAPVSAAKPDVPATAEVPTSNANGKGLLFR